MLPLDTLIHRLESAGFRISPADRLRVVQLLDTMGKGCLENPHKLRHLLAPILARSAAEQLKFYAVFDQWMPVPVEGGTASQSAPKTCWWLISVGLIILAGIATWFLLHFPTKPIQQEEIAQEFEADSIRNAQIFDSIARMEYNSPEVLKPRLPIKELLLAREQETPSPSWLAWSLLGLLILASGWSWWKWSRRAAPKPASEASSRTGPNRRSIGEIADAPPYTIPFRGQEAYIRTGREQYRLAAAMRQRQQGEHPYMDVPASVMATLDKGGFPTLRFRLRRQPPEYLCIVDERHRQSHLARLFRFFAEHIRGQDVALEIFQANSTLNRFWNAQYPTGISLDQLQGLYLAHRLLVFGDAHALLDIAATGQARVQPAMGTAFRRWRQRILLTPNAPATWTFEEKALYDLFAIFPATLHGLGDAAQFIEVSVGMSTDEETLPIFARWRERAQQRDPDPHDHRYTRWRDAADHAEYLTGRPDLLCWLQALAVYPTPTWEITLAIGKGLESQGIHVHPDDLLVLSRIEWLQNGRMPLSLREDFLAELPPAVEIAARTAVLEALEEARLEAGNGFAGIELGVNVAIQEFALAPNDPEKQENLRLLFEAGRVNKTQEQVVDGALAMHIARGKTSDVFKTSKVTARDFVKKDLPEGIEEGEEANQYAHWKHLSDVRRTCIYISSFGAIILLLLTLLQSVGGALVGIHSFAWLWLMAATLPVLLTLFGNFLFNKKWNKILNPIAYRALIWGSWIYFAIILTTILVEPFAMRQALSLREYLGQSMFWVISSELVLIAGYVMVFYVEDFFKRDTKSPIPERPFFTKHFWVALGLTLMTIGYAVLIYLLWFSIGWFPAEKEKRDWVAQNLFEWEVQIDSATVWNNRGVRVWNERRDTAEAMRWFEKAISTNDKGLKNIPFLDTIEIYNGEMQAYVNGQKLYFNLVASSLNEQFELLNLPPINESFYKDYLSALNGLTPVQYQKAQKSIEKKIQVAFGENYQMQSFSKAIGLLKPAFSPLYYNLTEVNIMPLRNDALHALGLASLYAMRRDMAESCYTSLIQIDSNYFINLRSPRPNLETLLGKLSNRILSVEFNPDTRGRLHGTAYIQMKEQTLVAPIVVAELLDKAGKILARSSNSVSKVADGTNQATFRLPEDVKTGAFTADSLRIILLSSVNEGKVLAVWTEARRFNWRVPGFVNQGINQDSVRLLGAWEVGFGDRSSLDKWQILVEPGQIKYDYDEKGVGWFSTNWRLQNGRFYETRKVENRFKEASGVIKWVNNEGFSIYFDRGNDSDKTGKLFRYRRAVTSGGSVIKLDTIRGTPPSGPNKGVKPSDDQDLTAPEIRCPSTILVSCDFNPSVTGIASTNDNTDPSPVLKYFDDAFGDCMLQCEIMRTWVSTDKFGNSSICKQFIKMDATTLVENALSSGPLKWGQSASTITLLPGQGNCVVKWLPYSGSTPTSLKFDDVVVGDNCGLMNNPLDDSGHIINPLLGEAIKLKILVRLNPALGTTKLSSFKCNMHFTIRQALSPDPDVNELIRITDFTLGNVSANLLSPQNTQYLLTVLKCVNEGRSFCYP